jgi:hypothetical protein
VYLTERVIAVDTQNSLKELKQSIN